MTQTTDAQDDSQEMNAPRKGGLRPAYFLVVAALVLLADQYSKRWIVNSMYLGDSRPIIGQAFQLTLAHNTGGAWSLLSNGNTMFACFAGLAIIALIFAYVRVGRHDIAVGSAFALALGGAVGNLIDRVRLGYVVDFFDARIIHWPIFNMADSAITVSIILLVYHYLREPKPTSPSNDNYQTIANTQE